MYELENNLVEVRQQINTHSKQVTDLQTQLAQEQQAVCDLEQKVTDAKRELDAARASAEESERLLDLEQQRKQNMTPTMFVASLPELTRTPSSFSGSNYIMSPQSDSDSRSKMSLSPVQAKSVLKYGFDLTAFDTLSIQESNAFAKSSVNDDLASLFGTPVVSHQTATTTTTTKSSNFDSIFM